MKKWHLLISQLIIILFVAACPEEQKTKEPTKPAHEGKKLSDLDKIMAHQDKRFSVLDKILAKNPKYHVKFPGKSAQNHFLGVGIARDAWSAPDHKKMVEHVGMLITDLMKKYPGRISFGQIGDFKLPPNARDCDKTQVNPEGRPGPQANGTFMIHVWGANDRNFNFENNHNGNFGSGQASCFASQRPGVFGISTMPGGSEADLMADDKLLALY